MSNNLSNRIFDVVVIGGGITGLGIALESSRCGFTSIVLEKDHICQATSDNSLRIFHGGLRYLQELNLLKVIESIKEQQYWLKDAPSLIKRLPCIMPLKRSGLKSKLVMSYAAKIYNSLYEVITKRQNGAAILQPDFIEKFCPILSDIASQGGFLWYDARLRDPVKFSALVRHRIDREGGEVAEGVEVSSVTPVSELIAVQCKKDNEEIEIISRVVINASGSDICKITFPRKHAIDYEFCRAFNIVLSRKLQDRFAFGVHTDKGRLLFAVPRAGSTAIGTGYLTYNDQKSIDVTEIESFIGEFNRALPSAKLKQDEVVDVESGLLPISGINRTTGECSLLKRAKIIDHGGFIDVISTKYTTFRSLGKQVMKKAIRYLR